MHEQKYEGEEKVDDIDGTINSCPIDRLTQISGESIVTPKNIFVSPMTASI